MTGDGVQKTDYTKVNRSQILSAILWPSFVLAGIANTLFFTFFDPGEIAACRGSEPLSQTASYSIGFFCFWFLTAATAAAAYYFLKPCVKENQ